MVAKVGIVGIGDMGMPILGSYVRGGSRVTAFDTREAALLKAESKGARRAPTLAALASDSDLVAVVVVDDKQVEGVVLGPSGLLAAMRPGATLVIHSTTLPKTVIELGRQAEAVGVSLLDAPVTGGTVRAESGDLTIYVGGDEQAFEKSKPTLDALGRALHVGPIGAGQAMKLTNNLMHFGNKVFVYLAIELARAHGITEESARKGWVDGSGDSWALANLDHLDGLLLNHTLSGTAELFEFLSKDVWSAAVAARQKGLHLPPVAMIAESLPALDAARLEYLRHHKQS